MKKLKILIACEESGSMRNAFASLGHDVISCDLKPTSSPIPFASAGQGRPHYQGDVFDLLPGDFDLLVGFPPCTFLSKAQMWMCNKDASRACKRDEAVLFVRRLLDSGVKHIALENPPGHLSAALRPYDQIIRPYQFGDLYHKEICLWLHNLPPISVLRSEDAISRDRLRSKSVNNHTNGRMKQSERAKIRSSWGHYPNMCNEIAKQWSDYLIRQ
jgi:hypothetical protein